LLSIGIVAASTTCEPSTPAIVFNAELSTYWNVPTPLMSPPGLCSRAHPAVVFVAPGCATVRILVAPEGIEIEKDDPLASRRKTGAELPGSRETCSSKSTVTGLPL